MGIQATFVCDHFVDWPRLYDNPGGRRGRDRMVVRFTYVFAISAYHH
jgi:hypothetical protein